MTFAPDVFRQMLFAAREEAGSPLTIEQMRRNMEALGTTMPIVDGVTSERIELGGVSGIKLTPDHVLPHRHLLYFHGGGYAIGSVETHRGFVSYLASKMNAVAWSMDYRLAPEAPYPAAIDDCFAAYDALVKSGVAANEIIMMGDSAGGGAALATALKAKDNGLAVPAALILLSPWTDLTLSGKTHGTSVDRDPIVSPEAIKMMTDAYLDGAEPSHRYISPGLADLSGLPPMLIQAGSHEMLLSDSIMLAENAGIANVDATLEIWSDMVHVFQVHYPHINEARKAVEQIAHWSASRLPS